MNMVLEHLSHPLSKPVKTSSLVLLRLAFGLIMFWEVIRYFLEGWVWELYRHDQFHFKYLWFQWVEPLPPPWMTIVFLKIISTDAFFVRHEFLVFLKINYLRS